MAYNLNHGWGQLVAQAVKRQSKTGKVLIVAASTLANWEELNEIFPPSDKVRVVTTLQAAIDLAGDGEDDLILVAPNHTETVTAAAGLDTGTDTAGLSIVGLGEADERPLISFTTATSADFDIGSNGVTFENLRFDLTGFDALVAPIDVNASGCTFRKCEFITADADGQATLGILTDANADYLTIDSCEFVGSNHAGTTTAVRIVGSDNVTIKNSYFDGAYTTSVGAIQSLTTAPNWLRV